MHLSVVRSNSDFNSSEVLCVVLCRVFTSFILDLSILNELNSVSCWWI